MGQHLSREAVRESGEVTETAFSIFASFGHQEVDVGVGVEINLLSERLDDGYHPGAKL